MCLFVLKHTMFCSCVIVEKAIYSLLCGERPPPLRVWDIDGQNICSSRTSHPIHPQKPSDTSQLQVVCLKKKPLKRDFHFYSSAVCCRVSLAEVYEDKALMKLLEENKPTHQDNPEVCWFSTLILLLYFLHWRWWQNPYAVTTKPKTVLMLF